MKYGLFILITILLGACIGGSESDINQDKTNHLIVSTQNQDGELLPVETFSYSVILEPDTKIKLECDGVCTRWELPKGLAGGVTFFAHTHMPTADPFCYDIYAGELYIVVDSTVEKNINLTLFYVVSICE